MKACRAGSYNSLSDEQKARFNSLRAASRPTGD